MYDCYDRCQWYLNPFMLYRRLDTTVGDVTGSEEVLYKGQGP